MFTNKMIIELDLFLIIFNRTILYFYSTATCRDVVQIFITNIHSQGCQGKPEPGEFV